MTEQRKEKRRRERGKSQKENKFKRNSKREIPQSWHHMPGPPFLMRQRSTYSLALSLTGGTPIMPKLTCSNNIPPPQIPPHSGSCRLPSNAVHLHSSTENPASFHRNPHIDGVRQLSPAREKELGVCPHSVLPSSPAV